MGDYTYNGPMRRGYARILKAAKRAEAEERNVRYGERVRQVASDYKITENEARKAIQIARGVELMKGRVPSV